jgi:hypothetical protein
VFTFDGQVVEPYFPPSSYPNRPVTRSDYMALAPLAVSTTTTTEPAAAKIHHTAPPS